MKKIFSSSLLILTLLLCACVHQEQSISYQEESPIIILHTNDVHAHIDENIGYAGLAAYKKQMEARYGEKNIILVDSGDAIQGASIAMLTKGQAIVTLMNLVDYDYFALGNHEFDYQIPRLFELSKNLNAHIVTANFIRLEDNTPVFSPYAIHTIGDIDIAFVGVTTPEGLTKASSQFFQDDEGNFIYTLSEDATGEKLYAIVQNAVDKARAEGAHYVVALTHLGIEQDAEPWRSIDLIENVSGIDIMLDGHSHSVIEAQIYQDKLGENVILSQAGSKLKYIGQVTISPNQKGKNKDEIVATLIDEKETLGIKDPEVQERINAIKAEFEELLSQNIAYSEFDLIASDENDAIIRKEETNLGNLVADAYRTLLNTEIALANGGGIRTNLLKGDITFQEIIDLHPFGNYIISMQALGHTIKDALEMGAKNSPHTDGGFLQVSGLTYEIDTSIPSSVKVDLHGNFVGIDGEYRVKNIQINGKPLDENKIYSIASHDYLLKRGGDGLTMFQDCKILKDMFMLDNEVLIQYITENLNGIIEEEYANPKGTNRIVILPQ